MSARKTPLATGRAAYAAPPDLARSAARAFIGKVLQTLFRDVLDLSERHQVAFAHVERAVRRTYGIPSHDLLRLENAVLATVSEQHRSTTRRAFIRYDVARTHELTAKQQAAYLIGVEVGRALRSTGSQAVRAVKQSPTTKRENVASNSRGCRG